ncbi:MAG: hypothetical protein IID60_05345 [Proteobacteria bacterium]|nr:hypothetical protein [Pseudomonadota bacterium]
MSQSTIKSEHKLGYKKTRVILLVLALSFAVPAQAETLDENPVQLPNGLSGELPGMEHLAASLSHQASRLEALLTMVVVDHLLEDPAASGQLEARWQDERAWLDRLAARFPHLPLRSSAMDPASWFVLLELDQHQITPSSLASPQGPETTVLIRQLFDRGDERLAAALLPEVLMRLESRSTRTWQDLLSRAAGDEHWLALVVRIDAGLAKSSMEVEFSPAGEEESSDPIKQALESFQILAASVMHAGAPDTLRLQQLRYRLLMAIPELDNTKAREAAQLLRLATAVDGLHENKFLAFAETLLWVVMEMLLAEHTLVATDSTSESQYVVVVGELPRVLAELLPQLSNVFARGFSDTDPRINAILAAAFDIVQNLQLGSLDAARKTYLQRELADAFAQLVLMIPDMNFYFDQPVRKRITKEINICTSIVAATGPDGETSLSRKQFDRCLAGLADLSATRVRRAELAGDPDGPFGAEQLRRELQLTPWQRINYALGYLHERYATACQLPEEPLANPLEWAVLATTLAWFAEQSPVYFQTPANEALVVRMRQQGMELLQAMEQQVACFSRAGKGINDPVRRSLSSYRRALAALAAGISEIELVFRQERLAPGADIVLSGDAYQDTAYRTEGLMIGPCQADRSCGMNDELKSTRALIGLFPDHYLVADQAGLGKIEICYDNISWVQRHSEPTRLDDPNVADYYGRLSFDLIGRYVEDGVVLNVFGSNFISPDEYHYLFAEASDEVLNDRCPEEWVGSKIMTKLNSDNIFRIVPDRLTYLASARSQPSQIITTNWSRGAEWRDWFVTGLGVTPIEYPNDEGISARIDQHLKVLYQAEQAMLYNALLRRPSRIRLDPTVSLYDQMIDVDTAKTLVRFYMSLFYPDLLMDSDEIRGFLEGTGALVDGPMLRRFRENNVPVESINDIAVSRLAQFTTLWIHQSKSVRRSGSVALSVAHAITRLNALYQAYFAPPPSSTENDELSRTPVQL